MSKTYFFNFVEDEDGIAKSFDVDLIEEYGEGLYELELANEYGTMFKMTFDTGTWQTTHTHTQVKSEDVPEPTDHKFKQTFNSFSGVDMIVRKDGVGLPLIQAISIAIAIDDSVPQLRAVVLREAPSNLKIAKPGEYPEGKANYIPDRSV